MSPSDVVDTIEERIRDSQTIGHPAGELIGLGLELVKKAFLQHPAPTNFLRELLATAIEEDAKKFVREKFGG